MNTHLHVLEAYSNLYGVWENKELKKSIELLLGNFADQIIDGKSKHLHLFFDEDWQVKDDMISYGHDIEASWLLWEAAIIIKEEKWIQTLKELSPMIAFAASKGLDSDGGLWYEMEHGQLVQQKHSWPQAEAMVGFFNAWEMTHDEKYLGYTLNNWQFIQQHIKPLLHPRFSIASNDGNYFSRIIISMMRCYYVKCFQHIRHTNIIAFR